MCGIDDIVDKVPEAGEDDEYVIDLEQPDFPDECLGYLVCLVVEYFDETGVVVVIPVYFFVSVGSRITVIFRRHVLHV